MRAGNADLVVRVSRYLTVLKQRLITGFVLAFLLVWSIFNLSNDYFAILTAVFVIQGAWEWARMANVTAMWQRVLVVLLVSSIILILWNSIESTPYLAEIIFSIAVVWWLLCGFWVFKNPQGIKLSSQFFLIKVLIGVVVLVPAWLALVSLHAITLNGPSYVLFILLLTAVADSGAYFSGKRWGSRKLAPRVSPGKTWEGVWGAVVLVAIYSIVGGTLLLDLEPYKLLLFIPLCLVVLSFSILGDLFESMIKRQAGIKDSGQILPGHGGVLDRIDSITAAAPVFVVGLSILEMVK